jgi:hypothetical protein
MAKLDESASAKWLRHTLPRFDDDARSKLKKID